MGKETPRKLRILLETEFASPRVQQAEPRYITIVGDLVLESIIQLLPYWRAGPQEAEHGMVLIDLVGLADSLESIYSYWGNIASIVKRREI